MQEFVGFGSRDYGVLLLLLGFSRGMDFLSTWVATPNMVLEGNPIAKKLGWRWGIPLNVVICLVFGCWPLPAITISTTSVLVAARNFQSAWLMRSMGEEVYRDWFVQRVQETRITLFLACLAGNTMLTAAVGAGVVYFSISKGGVLIPFGIGLGIIAYAAAVLVFSLLGVWRLRRAWLRQEARRRAMLATGEKAPGAALNGFIAPGIQMEGD
jgi:hypothetical protein